MFADFPGPFLSVLRDTHDLITAGTRHCLPGMIGSNEHRNTETACKSMLPGQVFCCNLTYHGRQFTSSCLGATLMFCGIANSVHY